MALALLEDLSHDLARLTWSGATLARGDPKLAAHASALAPLSAKAPALAKLAQLIGALHTSGDPTALLTLDLATQQLRATQLELPSPQGALDPLAPCAVSDFEPLPVRALHAFIDATHSKKKPADGVVLALQSLPFGREPRLGDALVDALGHAYLRQYVVPAVAAMGERVLPALEHAFKPGGNEGDAVRLRAIAAIKKERGAELYRACLAKGSAAVKLAALESMQFVSREELESGALALFDAEPHAHARWPIVPALLLAGSDAALERVAIQYAEGNGPSLAALLAHHDDALITRFIRVARAQAAEVARLIRVAQPGKAPAALRTVPLAATGDFAEWLLAARRPEALEVLRELLTFPSLAVRSMAAGHLIKLGDRPGLEAIVKIGLEENTLHVRLAEALFALGPEVAFERMQPLLPSLPSARPGLLGKLGSLLGAKAPSTPSAPQDSGLDPRLDALLARLTPAADPRWFEVLRSLCTVSPTSAVLALARLQDPRGVQPIIEVARRDADDSQTAAAFSALAQLKAPEGLPVMIEWLGAHPDHRTVGNVISSIRDLGDKSAIEPLRALAARPGLTAFVQQFLGHAIEALEQG